MTDTNGRKNRNKNPFIPFECCGVCLDGFENDSMRIQREPKIDMHVSIFCSYKSMPVRICEKEKETEREKKSRLFNVRLRKDGHKSSSQQNACARWICEISWNTKQ